MTIEDPDETTGWLPLHSRDRNEAGQGEYIGPHEGVPPWLMTSLLSWIQRTLELTGETDLQTRLYAERMERRLRRWVLLGSTLGIDPAAEVVMHAKSSVECVLDVVDYILDNPPSRHGAWEQATADPEAVFDALQETLTEAGSVWTVRGGGGHVSLVRRTTVGLHEAATRAMGTRDAASELLAQAWRDAFGRHPDPEDAYATAIKAVEAAAKEVVTPNDARATLSKMAAAMSNAPVKWRHLLDPSNENAVATVAELFRMLMRGHAGRHGTQPARSVGQQQAEAAVELAVVLVQWFRDGVVHRHHEV